MCVHLITTLDEMDHNGCIRQTDQSRLQVLVDLKRLLTFLIRHVQTNEIIFVAQFGYRVLSRFLCRPFLLSFNFGPNVVSINQSRFKVHSFSNIYIDSVSPDFQTLVTVSTLFSVFAKKGKVWANVF